MRGAASAAASAGRREATDILAGRITSGRLSRGARAAGCNSFATGTRVLLADGTSKTIEQIRTGDKVLASDPATGETSAETVTQTIHGTGKKHLTTLTINATEQAHPTKPTPENRHAHNADHTLKAGK